jgi:xylulokinase
MLLDAAQKNGITPVMPVAVTGGQAKNDQWMQMKCNYAGVPLSVCTCADAELIGDAVMAFTGLGIYGSLQQAASAIVRAAKTYVPEHKQ